MPYDKIGDVPLGGGGNLGRGEQRHDHRGMHIEGQRRRWTPLPERLESQRMAKKIDAAATQLLRDAQRQEAVLPQTVVVLCRVRCGTVVRRRAGSEVGSQLPTAYEQELLLLSEREIQATALPAPQTSRESPTRRDLTDGGLD